MGSTLAAARVAALCLAIAGCSGAPPRAPPESWPQPPGPREPLTPEQTWDAPLEFGTTHLPPRASLRLRGSFVASDASVSLAPSGRWLAVSRGAVVDVIDLDARPPGWRRLERPGSQVTAVAFSPDGTRLAVGFGRGEASVRLFDVASEAGDREVARIDWVDAGSLAFSPDGRRLLVAGSCLCTWNPADGKRDRVLTRDDSLRHTVLSADWRVAVGLDDPPMDDPEGPNGDRIITRAPERLFRWDTGSATPPVEVPYRSNLSPRVRYQVTHLALTGDGSRVLIASVYEPGLVVRELPSGREVARHPMPAMTAVLSPDGRMVAVGGLDDRIRLLTFPDLREVSVLEGHGLEGPPTPDLPRVLAFSQDQRRLVSVSKDRILVWALDAGAAP
jgi:WD40 repeat protein